MIIKEFLPNPVGADKDGEYIKIFNDGNVSVSLVGWKISDASNKSFSLSGSIQPSGELKLIYSQTKLSLNNGGETVFLFDANGALADKLGYTGAAEEGKIILKKEIAVNPQFENGQVLNQSFSLSIGKVLAFDVFLGIILGLAAVYVILQLEKKFNIKLF
ncbi:MAG: lamin tail domain-containing protein [bacterium]|nr:lamin tail domain-containing protein [bacterium]